MQTRIQRPFAAFVRVSLAALLLGGLTCPLPSRALPVASAVQQADDDEAELTPVKKSGIAPIALPTDAMRYTGKEAIAPLTEILKQMAKQSDASIGEVEVIMWEGDTSAKKALPGLCKEAGYTYTSRAATKMEGATLTPFTSNRKENREGLLGFWYQKEDNLLLIWTVTSPSGKKASKSDMAESASEAKPASGAKAAAGKESAKPASEAGNGKTPAELVGDWSWTTISAVGYTDPTTHRLMEPSGMSCRFTFSRDGRYKKVFYIRQRTYSFVTESTTTEEGTVTFRDGSFTMHPEKGYYKGNTGSRIIDRPMTQEERKMTVFHLEWRNESGKRQLYLGPDAQSAKLFKRSD